MAKWAIDWNIVRSQVSFQHVILTDRTLTFEPAEQAGELGYRISHNGSCCFKGSCKETFLRVQNGTVPELGAIVRNATPLQTDFRNDSVLKSISDYVNENGDSLARLVGDIELPDHALQPGEDNKMTFYVYQIANAVQGNRTMVYFQAHPDPNSAANGGGSVSGYS
ncbi:MAG TPA: hypothetical protein VGI23_24100 [Steroidobacteraceae bacterium]